MAVRMAVRGKLVSVKMGQDVYLAAKAVAAIRDQSVSEYLTEVLRPIVQRDFDSSRMAGRTKVGKP